MQLICIDRLPKKPAIDVYTTHLVEEDDGRIL